MQLNLDLTKSSFEPEISLNREAFVDTSCASRPRRVAVILYLIVRLRRGRLLLLLQLKSLHAARVAECTQLRQSISEFWNRLGVPQDQQEAFTSKHTGLGDDVVAAVCRGPCLRFGQCVAVFVTAPF